MKKFLVIQINQVFRDCGITLKELCVKNSLNYKSVHKHCIGRGKLYKGWKVEKIH